MAEVIANSVISSLNWSPMRVLLLTQPQRDALDPAYSHFVDCVGDGVPAADEEGQIALSAIRVVTDPKVAVDEYLKMFRGGPEDSCCIWCLTNAAVDEHNAAILERMQGKVLRFYSFNRISSEDKTSHQNLLSTDFMAQIQQAGVPPHVLTLKIGCVCTVERNLLLNEKVAHNTKVILQRVANHYLEVLNPVTKRRHLIPRITFQMRVPKTSLTFTRRQYPLRAAYAITVNKSQGQTLSNAILDLRTEPFSHGQVYVALSRVK